jgi:hypothetical protein
MKIYTKGEEGVCPKCGKSLEYGHSEIVDMTVNYDVNCPNEDCEFSGIECYEMTFAHQEDTND